MRAGLGHDVARKSDHRPVATMVAAGKRRQADRARRPPLSASPTSQALSWTVTTSSLAALRDSIDSPISPSAPRCLVQSLRLGFVNRQHPVSLVSLPTREGALSARFAGDLTVTCSCWVERVSVQFQREAPRRHAMCRRILVHGAMIPYRLRDRPDEYALYCQLRRERRVRAPSESVSHAGWEHGSVGVPRPRRGLDR